MTWILLVILIMVGLPLLLWGADRLLLWMERHGWIFYRNSRPDPKNLGPAFLEIEALLQPGKRHVLEQKVEQKEQEDDEGGPDKAGGRKPPRG